VLDLGVREAVLAGHRLLSPARAGEAVVLEFLEIAIDQGQGRGRVGTILPPWTMKGSSLTGRPHRMLPSKCGYWLA